MELRAIIASFGSRPAPEADIPTVVLGALDYLKDRYPAIRPHVTSLISGRSIASRITNIRLPDAEDPYDIMGSFARKQYPNESLYNVGPYKVNSTFYRCTIALPVSGRWKEYHRTDAVDVDVSPNPSGYDSSCRQSLTSDVRCILGCRGYVRRATILAGSEGFEVGEPESQTSRRHPRNRNHGFLAATLNDFNVLFNTLQGLTDNHHLPGGTAGGLVTKRNTLHDLIALTLLDESAVQQFAYNPSFGFSGAFLWNTRLHGVTIQKGVVMGGGIRIDGTTTPPSVHVEHGTIVINAEISININEAIPEVLFSPEPTDPPINNKGAFQYGLLYYAGHGAEDGSILIEPNTRITPQEIFHLSKQSGMPLLLILDMCHSATFGNLYQELLDRYKWPGIVFCANEEGTDPAHSLAYECEDLYRVRRPLGMSEIIGTDIFSGRGVYTTAFCLGLLKLKDIDMIAGKACSASIWQFNEDILRPICKALSERFSLPIQKPTIFGSTLAFTTRE